MFETLEGSIKGGPVGFDDGPAGRRWMSVITIENVEDFPARARGAYVTVGNFDGVHRGHQRLIGRLRARADAAGVPALAVTFDPHPVALLRPDKAPVPLVWPEREIALLEEAGATEVAVFRTGRWLLDLTAREFFDRVIRRQFAARGMVEGPNFAFGHDRQGDVEILRPVVPRGRHRLRGRRADQRRRPAHLVVADPRGPRARATSRRPRGSSAARTASAGIVTHGAGAARASASRRSTSTRSTP